MDTVPYGAYRGRLVMFLPGSILDEVQDEIEQRNVGRAEGDESPKDRELRDIILGERLRRFVEAAESVGGPRFYDPAKMRDRE